MIQIKKLESAEQLKKLKQQYINLTTAPLDGMWLCGFVMMANHFGFYEKDELVGFCCINDDGYLLQFYLRYENRDQTSLLFESILAYDHSCIKKIKGAFVSTAEPYFLSLCFDSFPTFEVNALMYQLDEKSVEVQKQRSEIKLNIVKSEQLNEAVNFAKDAIGAPKEWLNGYYGNLINRQELYGYWQKGRLLATGESRNFEDYQTEYGDVGFIVAESQRGKGLGTKVLQALIAITKAKGLKPICSTEKSNISAQKAISRVGFFAGNRIIQFDFSDDNTH